MLSLTRRVGEEIVIGDEIVLRVEEIRSGQVRLVFRGPRSVKILRRELLDRAGQTPPTDEFSAGILGK